MHYINKGMKPIPEAPSTKGKRSIVIGAISENGMVPASFKVDSINTKAFLNKYI